MNNEELVKKFDALTDDQKKELLNAVEYPALLHILTSSYLAMMNNIFNIIQPKNEVGKICLNKIASACENLSNSNIIINSLIQSENNKFIEGVENGVTEESTDINTDTN